jgi:hypothetical protein
MQPPMDADERRLGIKTGNQDANFHHLSHLMFIGVNRRSSAVPARFEVMRKT